MEGREVMQKRKTWAVLVSWQRIKIFGGIVVLCLLFALFFYTVTKTFQIQIHQSSSYIRDFFEQYEQNEWIFLSEQENHYFGKALDKDRETIHLGHLFLELAAGLNLRNPTSFLISEIPGFRMFDVHIVVDDGKTNFANISIEPNPKIEEIADVKEPEIWKDHFEEKTPDEQIETKQQSESQSKDQSESLTKKENPELINKPIYIYHTHNRESFRASDGKSSDYSKTNNITLVGEKLGAALEKQGIGTKVDKTDFGGQLIQRNLEYWQSYDVSRQTVQKYLKSNQAVEYIFDIHRDAIKRDLTTIQINGKNYARIVFVIGAENKNYKKNLQLAQKLHQLLNKKYEGISRNIVIKSGAGVNGVYNQDLSPNALTVEIGGVENQLEEFYRTVQVFAEVFASYYKEQEKK